MAKTFWQKKQQRKAAAGSLTTPPAPAPVPTLHPWYVTLIDTLEAIWNTLPASQSEPTHLIAQKLAELKGTTPPK